MTPQSRSPARHRDHRRSLLPIKRETVWITPRMLVSAVLYATLVGGLVVLFMACGA